MQSEHLLWYDKEASVWTEALPLGNGRIGAMAFGGALRDRFALNEDTLWSGHPRKDTHTGGPEGLALARAQLDEDDIEAAEKTVEKTLTGKFSEAYMPLGDLLIERTLQGPVSAYKRTLDIETGVHTARFTSGKTHHTISSFVINTYPQALVIDHACDAPGGIDARVRLECQLKHSLSCREGKLALELECPSHANPAYLNKPEPIEYIDADGEHGVRALAQVVCDYEGGTARIEGNTLVISGADHVTLKFCARTSYAGWNVDPCADGAPYAEECDAEAAALQGTAFDEMLARHIADFKPLMDRVDFALEGESPDLPTDERLMAFNGGDDHRLYELLFNYARYLMVSGSRPGTQAMNLQGIWNDSINPPWSSNYTININTEMNYYPAEAAALTEMHEPLFHMLENMCESGKTTAQLYYGMRGSVCHHNYDIWGITNPVGDKQDGCAVWAFWPMALGWMSRHLFDHYLYTLDRDFLRDRALPILREASRFMLDFLEPDENGMLRIYPATSPENRFIFKGKAQSVARSSTMANAICRELLGNYIAALDALKIDEPMRAEAEAALIRILPFKIGSKGQILEWDREYEEAEPHHRHTSCLYGLHPGTQITPEETPDLINACKRTLELRGDDGTGWSLGWKICFWARLRDGDHALMLLKNQLRPVHQTDTIYTSGGGTYPNMFDAHPPFQIDGNFGACAGMCEMLLNSRPGEIRLLPALPAEWKSGSVCGLRAMGRISVDISWKDGRLVKAVLRADTSESLPVKVFWNGKVIGVVSSAGETVITPTEG